MLTRIYKRNDQPVTFEISGITIPIEQEHCFYVESDRPLTTEETRKLHWLIAGPVLTKDLTRRSRLPAGKKMKAVEVGPLMHFETANSSNAVANCRTIGLDAVTRIERSFRSLIPRDIDTTVFFDARYDRMTQGAYKRPLSTFETGTQPEKTFTIPLLTEGIQAAVRINEAYGLGMRRSALEARASMFIEIYKRDPTIEEFFQIGQMDSEHSRHGFFKMKMVIDSLTMPYSLFDLVKEPWKLKPGNSVIAFHDNASSIRGFPVRRLIPESPGYPSPERLRQVAMDITFTAETHNHPSGVEPFEGGGTGGGGRERDGKAPGRCGSLIAGTSGFAVGGLGIPWHRIPGENPDLPLAPNLASPRDILIRASDGVFDYGNKVGEPVIGGFTRTFDLVLPDGRYGWLKPIVFSGGIGMMRHEHAEKRPPETGMLIIAIGGPAHRVGFGGGSASSMVSGENREALDYASVQRANAEMGQRTIRVIQSCQDLDDRNPIESIHDQGAGGPCNVVTELISPTGGKIDIRAINVGDKTLSVLEIWGAEYQERYGLLVRPENLGTLRHICDRERCPLEVLGEVTGDGRIVVIDSNDGSTPVDLGLQELLEELPGEPYAFQRIPRKLEPLCVPDGQSLREIVRMIFRLPSVGSKGFLTSKVDRSVTGLVAQQQYVGPYQLPVADAGVVALDFESSVGAVTAIGEQPLKVYVNPMAGVRMALAEKLTNMAGVAITDIEDIRMSGNWMWPAKLSGEGPRMYDAAISLNTFMKLVGPVIDGGKDSLSMAAAVFGEMVKGLPQIVLSGYAPVPDISKVATPDLKRPGKSVLFLVDPVRGKCRLGGSAYAQAHGQVGDEVPDIEDADLLIGMFRFVQELVRDGLALSTHDRTGDGGLVTAIIEMAMAGNCGVDIDTATIHTDAIAFLLAEEAGIVVECPETGWQRVAECAERNGVWDIVVPLGKTTENQTVSIRRGKDILLSDGIENLRRDWEETSYQLQRFQTDHACAKQEWDGQSRVRPHPAYALTFDPKPTTPAFLRGARPKVLILREEGSNGDPEMAGAFHAAGFEVWIVPMTDLLSGAITLDGFHVLAPVGGFSFGDVFGSGRCWAGTILFNERLDEQFRTFYGRPDTLSFAPCNGFQLLTQIGWVPGPHVPESSQPRLIRNESGRFESRWSLVKILPSPAIMLQEMEGSVLGIHSAHGEGRLYFPDKDVYRALKTGNLLPMAYVGSDGEPAKGYPENPNGSPEGFTAICSPDGRHLGMMPHPERAFLKWQWHYMPESWKRELLASPWLRMFQNARTWLDQA